MKRMIVITALLLFVFAIPVSAQGEDFYSQGYEKSGAGQLESALPKEARDYFNQNELNPADPNWVNNLTDEGIFTHLFGLMADGFQTPVKAGILLLSVLLIAAAFPAFGGQPASNGPAMYGAVVGIVAALCVPLWQTLSAAAGAIRSISTFMLAFVPVFATTVVACGGGITASAMSGLLLAAAEGLSGISAFFILPLMGGYLAMSLGCAVSPLLARSGIADSIKKIALWILSLISTVFVGILSIQTAVNSSADSLAMKTTKFIVGSSIPVAGAVLSEAVSTLTASLSLLRSSVGIFGVVALAVILLPILAELLLWRGILLLGNALARLFALDKLGDLLHAFDTLLALMLGILLLVGAAFILALTVVVTFGRGAA